MLDIPKRKIIGTNINGECSYKILFPQVNMGNAKVVTEAYSICNYFLNSKQEITIRYYYTYLMYNAHLHSLILILKKHQFAQMTFFKYFNAIQSNCQYKYIGLTLCCSNIPTQYNNYLLPPLLLTSVDVTNTNYLICLNFYHNTTIKLQLKAIKVQLKAD